MMHAQEGWASARLTPGFARLQRTVAALFSATERQVRAKFQNPQLGASFRMPDIGLQNSSHQVAICLLTGETHEIIV